MLKNCLRMICMLLIVTLLINMLPMSVFAQEFQESLSATEQAETVQPEESAEKAHIVKEVTENRTEFSKEFQLSNGLRMAAVYADAVHYETENGWEEIDNTLTLQTDGTYATTAGVWDVRFPSQLTKNKGITIQKDGYTLSFYMAGELQSDHELMSANTAVSFALTPEVSTAELTVAEMQLSTAAVQSVDFTAQKQSVEHPEIIPEKASSRLRYDNIYQNTNVVYDLSGNQVKESIILSKYNKSLRGYRYILDVGTMRPVLNEDGSIYFYNGEQTEIVMVMPAPYLVDANQDYCDDITVSLSGKDSTYTMTYQLPTAWLAASDRAWPVVVDPLVQADLSSANIRDRTVAENKTYAQNWGMNTCGYASDTGIMRFYLKYNTLPALSSSDVVVGAAVHMYKAYVSGTVTPVYVHKVNGTWDSSTITWENAPGFGETVEDYAIVDNVAWYGWQVTDIVRQWYAYQNTGMVFTASSEIENGSTDNFKQFLSSDFGTESSRPVLTICFRNNNGLEGYWDYTASSAGRAGTGYVNNFTGNMTWVRTDIGFSGNRMPVNINHVYNLNDAIVPSDGNNSNDSGGNSFGMGCGWRTNYNQLVYQWSVDNDYYVWEDEDGTDHYFKLKDGKLQDEDGLELTLTTTGSGTKKYCITDKNGNCRYFDEYGRLSIIENNQQTKSTVTITYSEGKIHQITDGAGRVYNFIYANGLIYYIEFLRQDGTSESYATFNYTGNTLTAITQKGSGQCRYTYSGKLLTAVSNADGHTITYTYNNPGESWQPYRVQSVSESYGTAEGGSLTMAYAHNQTTFTDHNGNVEIQQFNDYGNTTCIQDDEGHAQYTQFALNTDEETENNTDATKKTNQLRLSSKLQNTVVNILPRGSFEVGNSASYWTVNNSSASHSRTTQQHYIGNASLKFDCTAVTGDAYLLGTSFQVQPGQTYTFSAYVKTGSADVCIGMTNISTWATTYGETLGINKDWTRIQVHYTNKTEAVVTMRPSFCSGQQDAIYIDCAQVEESDTASRFNLVENGDFRNSTAWSSSTGITQAPSAAAPQLDANAYKLSGSPESQNRVTHTMQIYGDANDTLVMTGWALADSVPLTGNRKFGMMATVDYTDGSSKTFEFSFNPDANNTINWQYGAMPFVPTKAYSSVTVTLAYDYNVNTAYFDGIQLYKEEFGSSYTYDSKGNVISVTDLQKQTTTYEYDTSSNLTKVIQDNKAKMTYTYDSYHNVETATTQEGLAYNFTYDTYGNNTAVSITKDGSTMSSSATYSTDGNRLVSTTDALGNETLYGYNADTNVLDWVQYPNDTAATRTEYDYDSMYRMASAACETDTGNILSAEYTYENDRLKTIETPSTTYSFTYGDFGLRDSVSAGTMTLASYEYTEDANRYLSRLDYGNGDKVQYTYDNKGRLLTQTYEDGDKVTYTYDNNGALATMVDHATGITTTYYYDLTDRMMKYVESGTGYSHGVAYTYDEKNNLKKLEETIGGVNHVTEYDYDDDNRIETVTANGATITYTYDDFGRVTEKVTKQGSTEVRKETFTYVTGSNGAVSAQVATHTVDSGMVYDIFEYTYDGNGNITTLESTYYTVNYTYDSANQLIREDNDGDSTTRVWTYDNAGNILSRKEYNYTTGSLEGVTPNRTADYLYENSQWGDLLMGYDYDGIQYDAIGNPTYDFSWIYTWEHGRQLASMTNGRTTWSYSYNADGMRTQRSDGDTTYNYIYNGSQLTQMTADGHTLTFTYDAEGRPSTVTMDGETYYYVTNLQGDVLYLTDAEGIDVVRYSYSTWGECYWDGDPVLGALNPLAYRGYVYDQETGLYYLQSRYYNPRIGRFINADAFAATGQGLLGNNMFAYCGNNPVLFRDTTGTRYEICSGVGGRVLTSGLPTGHLTYETDQSPKGELYEYWNDANGKRVWSRHHSDHGNPKNHSVPHDHAWEDDEDGHNKPGPPLPPNPQFKAPNTNSTSGNDIKKIVGTMAGTATIGVVAYIGIKWVVAAILAPPTSGGSLIVASVTP